MRRPRDTNPAYDPSTDFDYSYVVQCRLERNPKGLKYNETKRQQARKLALLRMEEAASAELAEVRRAGLRKVAAA